MFHAEEEEPARYRVHVCFGPNCTPRGSRELLPHFLTEIGRAGLSSEVDVIATTCRGRCDWGPSVNVYPGPTLYSEVTPDTVVEIVRRHLAGGMVVRSSLFTTVTARSRNRGR